MNGKPNTLKITPEQFLRFNEQLLGLVRARVPLDRGLRQVAVEMSRGRLQNFIATVAQDLEQGRQLSESLTRFQPELSDYYVALVHAGETGGSLAEVLHHVVMETRRQLRHRRVLVSSLAYPGMVIVMAIAVLSFIMVNVIPHFVDIFSQLGADLPLPTQFLVNVSAVFLHYLFPLAVLVVVVGVVVVAIAPGGFLRPFRDALLLNFPIINTLVYNDIATSFSRCLGFLLARGVAMTDALALTGSVLRNVVARGFVAEVHDDVVRGERFSDTLERHPFLPPSTRWMIRLAEDRGDLDRTLLDLGDFYEMKNEQLRRTIGGLIEPMIILGLGLVIGMIIITLYLPLFTIPKLIR